MSTLRWQLTSIYDFDTLDTVPYGTVQIPSGGEVTIPLNDSRTASVTVSVYEDVIRVLANLPQIPYAVCLKAYYNGLLVFWGPINTRTVDLAAGTVTFTAIDPSIRLIRHHLRRGDLEGTGQAQLTEQNSDQGWVSADYRGFLALRDAAETEGFAPTGIADAIEYDGTSTNLIGVTRGDQVWDTAIRIANTGGPDFELAPDDQLPGSYCRLNVYQGSQGVYRERNQIALHYGLGLDNLEGMTFNEGEEYRNLVHVLDSDSKFRITRSNATTLARTGPYVEWVASGFAAPNDASDEDVENTLEGYADDVLHVRGFPTSSLSLTMRADSLDGTGYRYGRDYGVGDRIYVAGRAGYINIPEERWRITQVTLRQDGEADVRPDLEVVAINAGTIDGTDT